MKWILLFILIDGHVNADIKQMTADAFLTKAECKQAGKEKTASDGHYVCFPVGGG